LDLYREKQEVFVSLLCHLIQKMNQIKAVICLEGSSLWHDVCCVNERIDEREIVALLHVEILTT